ncbi:hypothetical protein D3C87_2130910 [compost metagenome]
MEEALIVGDRIILMGGSPGRVFKEIRLHLGRDAVDRRSNPLFYNHLAEISNELRLLARSGSTDI